MMNQMFEFISIGLAGAITLGLFVINIVSLFRGRRFYLESRSCPISFE